MIKNSNEENFQIVCGLVDVTKIDSTLVVDLKYAKKDNFLKRSVYPIEKAVLQLEVAKKLAEANDEFHKYGFTIKIWDAYRPFSVQKMMWEIMPNDDFIANPSHGSVHNRGAAVDVTLVDKVGREMEMTSGFDDFTEKAFINYNGATAKAIENREFLAKIMMKHGFTRLESEWWHFYGPNAYRYPISNVKLEEFLDYKQ